MGPLGIIIGPFLGAYLGELLNQTEQKQSEHIRIFDRLVTGVFLKFTVAAIFCFYFSKSTLFILRKEAFFSLLLNLITIRLYAVDLKVFNPASVGVFFGFHTDSKKSGISKGIDKIPIYYY